ncbi:putative E3 ubiquitin-protein ligase/polycomb group RING finger protein [Tanacetum coccineum]
MIMYPAQISSSKYVNGGFLEGGYDCFISLGGGCSDLMAEDESRTDTSINNEEAGSSSKDINININTNILNERNTNEDDHNRWLELSLGGGHTQMSTASQSQLTSTQTSVDFDILRVGVGRDGGSSSRRIPQHVPPHQLVFQVPDFRGPLQTSTNIFMHQPQQSVAAGGVMNSAPFMALQQQLQHQQETNYNYLQLIRPFPVNMMTPVLNPPVSSSSSFSGSSEHQGRQHHVHRRLNVARVVNPPRRPHSGVWFVLQASQNQAKEPYLPQIPKSYLRIKDGRMTVGLLIKYLVNKLGLGSESELYFRSNLKGESPSNDCKNMVGEYNLKETLEQTRKWIEGYA